MEIDVLPQAQEGTKRKLGFLDLPKDVRRIVYRHLLVQKKPFTPLQLCPIKRYFKALDERIILLQAGIRLPTNMQADCRGSYQSFIQRKHI